MGIAGTFIFMIVIGAAIGAVTNHLAIQMLFRPYKAYYLFGKRVPFTPGLIPRRRDELAKQMGLMVVNHLLTPEGIKKRLVSDAAKTQALRVGEQLIQKLSLSEVTVKEALEKAGMKRPEKAADAWISSWTDDKLHELFRQYGDQSLKELVPIEVQEKLAFSVFSSARLQPFFPQLPVLGPLFSLLTPPYSRYRSLESGK